MVDRVAQDRNETEDYSMKNEMENGQEPQENGEKPRCTAIILAAGSGSRMQSAVAGGAERYLSVGRALQLIADGRLKVPNEHGYVFIHDGARPFLTEKILEDTYAAAVQYQACVAAVQSKDTVKISDGEGFALSTPDRRTVWNIQTPQVFETSLILQAYERLKNRLPRMQEQGIQVTDDASVVELFTPKMSRLFLCAFLSRDCSIFPAWHWGSLRIPF